VRSTIGTMMALRAHARGRPEQLVCEQARAPAVGPCEVLIAMHAAAITFAELTWDLSWTTDDSAESAATSPRHTIHGRFCLRSGVPLARIVAAREGRRLPVQGSRRGRPNFAMTLLSKRVMAWIW
jgi:hypothetical protein